MNNSCCFSCLGERKITHKGICVCVDKCVFLFYYNPLFYNVHISLAGYVHMIFSCTLSYVIIYFSKEDMSWLHSVCLLARIQKKYQFWIQAFYKKSDLNLGTVMHYLVPPVFIYFSIWF